jgi:hypothetical protein
MSNALTARYDSESRGLVRATLSFSKNLANHIGAIKYFICDYNLTKCAALPGWHYQSERVDLLRA